MLFIVTNSQDATADFLISALQTAGIQFIRLDTDKLLPRIALAYQPGKASIRLDGIWFEASDISHIWYRRPEKLKDTQFTDSPEGRYGQREWTEFIECFFAHVPQKMWVNHPSANAAASRKLEQLTVAAALGFNVPDTLVTQEPSDFLAFYRKHDKQVIVKPISSGYIERSGGEKDSLIYTNRVLDHHLERLNELKVCPTLFQEFIQKKSDVRITVIDQDIHAVEMIASDSLGAQRCDIRRDNMSDVSYRIISLPYNVETTVRALMSHYSLRFAAIDMAVSRSGEWYFFEVNPNGQWAWLDLTAKTNIAASFVRSFSEPKPSSAWAA